MAHKVDPKTKQILDSCLLAEDDKDIFIQVNETSICLDKRRKKRPTKAVSDIIASMELFYEKCRILYKEKRLAKITGRLEELVGIHGTEVQKALITFVVKIAETIQEQLSEFLFSYKRSKKWIGDYANKVHFYNAVPAGNIFDEGDHDRFRAIARKVCKQANRLLLQISYFENLNKAIVQK